MKEESGPSTSWIDIELDALVKAAAEWGMAMASHDMRVEHDEDFELAARTLIGARKRFKEAMILHTAAAEDRVPSKPPPSKN